MQNKHELFALPRVILKGIVVVAIGLSLAFGMNAAMQHFLDAEIEAVKEANTRAAERAALLEDALRAAEGEASAAILEAQIAIAKREQEENFYQRYKHRNNYQALGQFYEMHFNTYSADTILIGTSRAEYGINPKYLEEAMPERSWFNFSLDGTNPEYYVKWWEYFLESGYPIPDTIVYCVDWFMCDTNWLWRRINNDASPSGALGTVLELRKSTSSALPEAPAPDVSFDAEGILPQEESEQSQKTEEERPEFSLFNLDATIEYLFNRIPIIYARDRIPEMIAFYLNGAKIALPEDDDIADELAKIKEMLQNTEIPEMPVYEHEYLVDQNGSITSTYYKGHIVREKNYTGARSNRSFSDSARQWQYFEQLLDTFESHGIHVVFIEPPEYSKGRYINGDRDSTAMEDCNARIRAIAEERGITFLNYNGELASAEINEDYTKFFDWGHLNGQGSILFSTRLAEDLKAYFSTLDNPS